MSNDDGGYLDDRKPEFVSFLGEYMAKKIKENRKQKIHVQHELARWSKTSDTIPTQKQTSVMIRDKYIASVYNMHREQCKTRREEEEPEVENTSYGYKKYMLNVHPTDGLALDFVRPSMHKKQI